MSRIGTVVKLNLEGAPVWFKRYGSDLRSGRLCTQEWLARKLGVSSLRPPPRRTGTAARLIEKRRLRELERLEVNVPRVLGEGEDCLLLSDMGETLSVRLRRAKPDEARALLGNAMAAIAQVHRRGGYLGAPAGRNLTVTPDGRIGFLDFEEDPGEVMSLTQAQARDWLVFAAGVAHRVPFDERVLADIFVEVLREQPRALRHAVGHATSRLSFLRVLRRFPGRRLSGLGKAVGGLQRALWSKGGLTALFFLGMVDLLHDGELEIVQALVALID